MRPRSPIFLLVMAACVWTVRADPDERRPAAPAASAAPAVLGRAVPQLVAGLQDPDDEVRLDAAVELGRRGSEARSAAEALCRRLEDTGEDRFVRAQAARTLGRMAPLGGDLAHRLVRVHRDAPLLLRRAVLAAAAELGDEAVIPLLLERSLARRERRDQLQSVLLALQDRWLPVLSSGLASRDPPTRESAMKAIDRLEEDERRRAIPILVDVLGSEDEAVRLWSQDLLVRSHNLDGPAVHASLGHADPGVRIAGAHILGRVGPEAMGAFPSLVDRLQDPVPEVRRAARQALVRVARHESEALGARLAEAPPEVQRELLQVLAEIGPEAHGAGASVLELRDRSTGDLRRTAQMTLERISRPD